MIRVWFGLADLQTKLSGLGLDDCTEDEDEEASNRYIKGQSMLRDKETGKTLNIFLLLD